MSEDVFSYANSESIIRRTFIYRKNFGLSLFDVSLFLYLTTLSRRRVFIKMTTAELAEDIQEPVQKVRHSLKALHSLNLCKRVKYSIHSGIMVNPEIINNGPKSRQAFKFKLWDEKTHSS